MLVKVMVCLIKIVSVPKERHFGNVSPELLHPTCILLLIHPKPGLTSSL